MPSVIFNQGNFAVSTMLGFVNTYFSVSSSFGNFDFIAVTSSENATGNASHVKKEFVIFAFAHA